MIKNKALAVLSLLTLLAAGTGVAHAASSGLQNGFGTTNIDLPARGVLARIVVNAFGGAVDVDAASGNFRTFAQVYCQDSTTSSQTKNGSALVNDGDVILGCAFLVPVTATYGALTAR